MSTTTSTHQDGERMCSYTVASPIAYQPSCAETVLAISHISLDKAVHQLLSLSRKVLCPLRTCAIAARCPWKPSAEESHSLVASCPIVGMGITRSDTSPKRPGWFSPHGWTGSRATTNVGSGHGERPGIDIAIRLPLDWRLAAGRGKSFCVVHPC